MASGSGAFLLPWNGKFLTASTMLNSRCFQGQIRPSLVCAMRSVGLFLSKLEQRNNFEHDVSNQSSQHKGAGLPACRFAGSTSFCQTLCAAFRN